VFVHGRGCCADYSVYLSMASPAAASQRLGAGQTKMCQFKLVLLGESAVGKSSLVLRFVKGQFHEYQESTIGGRFRQFVGHSLLQTVLYLDQISPISPLQYVATEREYRIGDVCVLD